MKKIRVKIEGTQPLMLNNNQVVNPFNKYTKMLKPLTSKKKKTDEDMVEIYRLQFESSLYMKGDTYIIPLDHFWKSVCTAAKEQKLGKRFEQSLQIFEDSVLDFPEKEMSPDELYKDGTHVDIRVGVIGGRSSVPVCRAIFNEWSTTVEAYFDESQLDKEEVLRFFEIAGQRYGVGTYRKKFGRFSVKEIR